MSKLKKIIIVIIYVLIVSLIILISKDYIIRQYFIRKLESVEYDEYIITTSYNGKKKEIAYYTDEFCMIRAYDRDGNMSNLIEIYDYTKNVQYHYYIEEDSKEIVKNQSDVTKSLNLNNSNLLSHLKNKDRNKRKFKYKGVEKICNKDDNVLYFEEENNIIHIFYLDKEKLYVFREIISKSNELNNSESDDCMVVDYEIDFNLNQKSLFKLETE